MFMKWSVASYNFSVAAFERRSFSRHSGHLGTYGQHDFGTNASRIRRLLDDIDESVGPEEEPLKKPAEKPPKSDKTSKQSQPPARR